MPKKLKVKDGKVIETNEVEYTAEQVNSKIALLEGDINHA
jgi:hypothetical protein